MKKSGVFFSVCCLIVFSLGYIDMLSADIAYTPMGDISMTGGIKGTIKCDNGDLIEDAWIYVVGESFVSTTNNKGNFILWYVPEGTYTLKISWESGEEQRAEISVKRKMFTDLGAITVTCPSTDQCAGRKDGFPCNDEDDCTTNDACKNGACVGTPLNCDDGNSCTEDECAPVVGCIHQPLSGVSCDDRNACTSNDVCDSGVCSGGPVNCNDWNYCTLDDCDPKSGCTHQPLDGILCDDGTACTTNDICSNGRCVGNPLNCDDGNPCTKDVCDQIVGCTHQLLHEVPCDDGNACTAKDACNNGTCIGTHLNCDDGNACTEDGCDPKTGCIHKPANQLLCDDHNSCTSQDICTNGVCMGRQIQCDDSNPCTKDECDPISGCVHKPLSGVSCDDGNVCTNDDICTNGICGGTPVNCSDGNYCTDDSCVPVKGCIHTPSKDPSCTFRE
jgi:hypothetical protein